MKHIVSPNPYLAVTHPVSTKRTVSAMASRNGGWRRRILADPAESAVPGVHPTRATSLPHRGIDGPVLDLQSPDPVPMAKR
jgi:hypothetical protein